MKRALLVLVVMVVVLLPLLIVGAAGGWNDVRCASTTQQLLYTRSQTGSYSDSGLRMKAGLIFQVPEVYAAGQYVLMRWTDGASGSVSGLFVDSFKCQLTASNPGISSQARGLQGQASETIAHVAASAAPPVAASEQTPEVTLFVIAILALLVVLLAVVMVWEMRSGQTHLKDALSSDAVNYLISQAFAFAAQFVAKTPTEVDNKLLGAFTELLIKEGWKPNKESK